MAIDTARAARTRAEPGATDTAAPALTAPFPGWRRTGGRVSGRDLIYFTSQLSLMLEVGTSLTDAVRALEGQTENPALRSVLHDLGTAMEEGQSFSMALSRHERVFDGMFVSMVRAGEAGGYLRDALERIVEMREKREALIAQVRSALAYPIILGGMSIVVVIFVVAGVLPKFMPLFAGKEHILPLSTRMLMWLSRSLCGYWWAYILAAAVAVTGLRGFLLSPPGRSLRDRLAVTLPVIGPLTNKILTGQLLRTLGHLLESHVPLTDALTVTRLTIRNRYYRRLVDRVEEIVRGGGRLATAFQGFAYMPASVRQMLATGEEAGNLYRVMLRLARHYDGEIEHELKRVAALIEPIALIFLGSIVGLIVSSVILPLFKLAHAMT